MEVNYKLKQATIKNKDILYNYKVSSILDFNEMSLLEKEKVSNYIINSIKNHIKDYKLLLVNNNIVGCYCSYIKEDYIYLDEIYIEEEYRSLGIGTSLIKQEIDNANCKKKNIELWVYKDNEKAINLYKKLGFIIIDESKGRYLMRYIAS